MKVTLTASRDICLSLVGHLNCKTPEFMGLIDGRISVECGDCKDNETKTNFVATAQQQCRTLDPIDHCEDYKYQTKQLICTKCRANYWLDEDHNTCKNLTVVNNC